MLECGQTEVKAALVKHLMLIIKFKFFVLFLIAVFHKQHMKKHIYLYVLLQRNKQNKCVLLNRIDFYHCKYIF